MLVWVEQRNVIVRMFSFIQVIIAEEICCSSMQNEAFA
jgi:hypothetical protein